TPPPAGCGLIVTLIPPHVPVGRNGSTVCRSPDTVVCVGDFDVVTAGDVRLMQGLAQRVTAVRPDLVNSDATFGSWPGSGVRDMPVTAGPGRVACGFPAASWPRRGGPICRTGCGGATGRCRK